MHEPGKEEVQDFSLKSYFVPLTKVKAIHFIIIIGFIVYFNGLFNNFIGDDVGQITDNVFVHSIKNINVFFIGSTFSNGGSQIPFGNYYKPLLLTFYSGIYTLFGPNYFVFHLFQLLLHITNTIILFLIYNRFFRKSNAFILSLIFLLHPINSEVVYSISDLQDVLFFLFGIIALWIIQNYESKKAFILSSVCISLSLFSKETGTLFLFLAATYIYLFKRKYIFTILFSCVTFFIIYFLFRVHAIGIFANSLTSSIMANSNLSIRIYNIPAMIFYYLKTFLYPLDLAIAYQWVYTSIDFSHFFLPLIIDLLFIIIVVSFSIVLYYKYPLKHFLLYIFFCIWFLLGISFHLQIIPLDQTVAERWFYLPMVGILGMLGVLFEVIRIKTKYIFTFALIIIISLSIRTFIRSFDWRNEMTLASHDIKISKDAWALENMLAIGYAKEGKYEDAKVHIEKSIKIYPHMITYMNLGIINVGLGDYKHAKVAYLKSIHEGDYYQTYVSLALLSTIYGNPQDNINFIKQVELKKFPKGSELWLYLAIIEYNNGNVDQAKIDIQQAYTLNQNSQISSIYGTILSGQQKIIHVNIRK